MKHPWGQLQLTRWPARKKETLLAFDACDSYLLQRVEELGWSGPISVYNDRFGALSLALRQGKRQVSVITDSALSLTALGKNRERNSIQILPLTKPATAVVMRVPKSLDLFAQQLAALPAGSPVLAGGMVKHLPHRALHLMEEFLGPTQLSRAWKKARILECPEKILAKPEPPPIERREQEWDLHLSHYPGVFSRGRLDRGTRLLLAQLPNLELGGRVLDLACGDGVLGLAVQRLCPSSQLTFVDESAQAIRSARANQGQNFSHRPAAFHWQDRLTLYKGEAFDLILCNPPFHQDHNLGDEVAFTMLSQAKQHLKAGGSLVMVGNRHLNYHLKLKRIYERVEILASDEKFVVLRGSTET